MRKLFLTLTLLVLASVTFADEVWLGMYLQGMKIGHMHAITSDEDYQGKPAKKSISKTSIDAAMLGASMKMSIDSTSYSTAAGRPLYMEVDNTSAGRTQKLKATFSEKEVVVVILNGGNTTTKKIPIPTDAPLVDDAVMVFMEGSVASGSKMFYVLDTTSIALIKNEVKLIGPSKVEVKGTTYDATLIEVIDPRITMKAYVSAKGDLIKMDGPLGIEMIPITEAEAMAAAEPDSKQPDLANVSSIPTDKPIGDIYSLARLKLKITGKELSRLPNDAHQTVSKSGGAWVVDLHPIKFGTKPITIAAANKQQPNWAKAGHLIPSASSEFKKLGKQIVGNAKTVDVAAKRVHSYVHKIMMPNAGIGVLRDATEVLETKEGVCRDYAILTATLLRAAKVPTRVASGLVCQDDRFYYHAWVEVWDGKHWVGIDSTRPTPFLSAAHIKLANGSVEQAFDFPLLDNVKVEVIGITKRS